MWFYIFAAIVVVGFVWWLTRTNVFRHYRSGATKDPGQRGRPGGWNDNGGGGIEPRLR